MVFIMVDITIEKYDDTYARVTADVSIKMELSDYFCFEAEGARFHRKVKHGLWDGKIRLFGSRYGELPIGLVPSLIKWASKNKYTVDNKVNLNNELSREAFDKWLDEHPVFDGSQQITPHWYQSDAAYHFLTSSRCLLQLPTSAGKSLIIGLCAKYYQEHYPKKILVIVPTIALVKQMKDDLINYRLFGDKDILCIKSGTERDSNSVVYVSTWQTASKQPKEWFAQFGMLMTDECHLGTGASLTKINQGMVDCEFKAGLTGTLKDAKAHIMQLIGLYGPIYHPVTTSGLMKTGQVTDLDIRPILIQYPNNMKEFRGLDYPSEIKWLITNHKRNVFISKLAASVPEQNTIVLFKERKHGQRLFEIINNMVVHERKVIYIAGDVKPTERETLRDIIENIKGAIIIASYGTMSTGVSIKNLHRAICAHPIKSKIINLQSIGRVLRKHDSKSKAMWFDLIDDFTCGLKRKKKNFAFKHGIDRLRLYSREQFNYKMSKISL